MLSIRPVSFRCKLAMCFSVFLVAGQAMSASVQADDTGMASMHTWTKERGKTCLLNHYHSGTGTGRTKKLAKRAAITSWQEFTAWEYGTDWAYFRRASSRSVSVTSSGAGWEATVEARPCRRYRRKRRRR